MTQDTVTIKTSLRPDYYEFFPHFSTNELRERLRYLPFHKATLLLIANIETSLQWSEGRRGIVEFLSQPFDRQRELLVDILMQVGIDRRVAQGIGRVRREQFTHPDLRRFSYLNHSVPYDHISRLSPPGLIALMIERLHANVGQSILEVGIGSAYHAACVSEVSGNGTKLYGVEINRSYAGFGRRCLDKEGYKNISLIQGDGYQGYPGNLIFDRIYITASFIGDFPNPLVYQLTEGGIIQGTRALKHHEFNEEPPSSWIRTKYGNYQEYLKGPWRLYSCLSTCKKVSGFLVEEDRIYDVQFVPLENGVRTRPMGLKDNPFKFLINIK